MIKLDATHLNADIDFKSYQSKVSKINDMIVNRNGPGNDYLGWYKYPETYNKEEA